MVLLATIVVANAEPPTSEELVRQETAVEVAALAVAEARQKGVRPKEVAALMAAYRVEAEKLVTLEPRADADETAAERSAAIAALTEATAKARPDLEARTTIEAWLGPLDTRLDLVEQALAAATGVRSTTLAHTMAVDAEVECTAARVASAFDAARAETEEREAKMKAAAVATTTAPGGGSTVEAEVDVRALLAAADDAHTHAETSWSIHQRALALCERASAQAVPVQGGTP